MPYKLCPNCNQTSYSACDRGVWNCPYCGRDITFVSGSVEMPLREIIKNKKKTYPKYLRLVE